MDNERAPTLEAAGLTPDDVKVYDFDAGECLDTPEAMSVFMDEAFATGSARIVADSLGVVAKSIGMAEIARRAGMSRQEVYDALIGKTTPRLDAIRSVVTAMGLRLSAAPHTEPPRQEREETATEAA